MIRDPKQRNFFVFRDLVFLSCSAIVLALFVYSSGRTPADGEKYADISVDGQIARTIPFGVEEAYSFDGRPGVQIAARGGNSRRRCSGR
jgi:hypothetical protein